MADKAPAHVSVLLDEVLTFLRPAPGGRYVDCTVGAGGHAEAILQASSPDGRLLGLDLDPDALRLSTVRLRAFGERVLLEHRSYRDLAAVLAEQHFTPVDGVLLDLGVSSMQLDQPERGFSFSTDGPLDMRFDSGAGQPVAALIATIDERRLADLLFRLGEERRSRAIARAIVRRRAIRPFHTTADLARVVAGAATGRDGRSRDGRSRDGRSRDGRGRERIHPATRTFQALRIAVNDELGGLEATLPACVDALRPGGRVAVIAFHSLEDRIVKHTFRAMAAGCRCRRPEPVCRCPAAARLRLLTPKPVSASPQEQAANPRSRSAKLRVAEKLSVAQAS